AQRRVRKLVVSRGRSSFQSRSDRLHFSRNRRTNVRPAACIERGMASPSSIRLPGLVLGFASAAILVGCGSGTQVDVFATSAEPLPNTTGSMSQPPAGTITPYLEVTVREVSIHLAGANEGDSKDNGSKGAASPQQDASGSGWTTVVRDPQRLNLLDAHATE